MLLADPCSEDAAVLLSSQLFLAAGDTTAALSSHSGGGDGVAGFDAAEVSNTVDAAQVEKQQIAAVEPLKAFLKLRPNNYNVLEQAISLLRRTGKLDEVR